MSQKKTHGKYMKTYFFRVLYAVILNWNRVWIINWIKKWNLNATVTDLEGHCLKRKELGLSNSKESVVALPGGLGPRGVAVMLSVQRQTVGSLWCGSPPHLAASQDRLMAVMAGKFSCARETWLPPVGGEGGKGVYITRPPSDTHTRAMYTVCMWL